MGKRHAIKIDIRVDWLSMITGEGGGEELMKITDK